MLMRPMLCGLFGLALAASTLPAGAHGQLDDLLKQIKQGAHGQASQAASLPSTEVAAGLKEALAKGTTHAINALGRTDGFWGNAKVRIPLPGKLKQVGELARQLGQGEKVDAFELSMNRAAEKAVPQVADIFGDAIRRMTLQDARGILAGGDHAATEFFRRSAGDALTARIRPIVAQATENVGVTRKYKALVSGQGSGLAGMLGSLGGGEGQARALDLDDYVTAQTLDGLFTVIGEQEQAIRRNPVARTTELLKKVFGKR